MANSSRKNQKFIEEISLMKQRIKQLKQSESDGVSPAKAKRSGARELLLKPQSKPG